MADWEWLLRCLRAGRDVFYIPRSLILYRQHEASVSSSSFRVHRDVQESFQIIHENARYLSSPDVASLYGRRFVALARRAGISLARRDFERARAALALMAKAPWNALRSVLATHSFTGASS
jgi:GT2 family glycosyltransferase